MIFISSLRYFVVALRNADVPQLNQRLLLSYRSALDHRIQSQRAWRTSVRDSHSLRTQQVVVPNVNKHITGASSRQQPLTWVPLGKEYFALMLFDDANTLAIGNQRNLVLKRVGSAVLHHCRVQLAILLQTTGKCPLICEILRTKIEIWKQINCETGD